MKVYKLRFINQFSDLFQYFYPLTMYWVGHYKLIVGVREPFLQAVSVGAWGDSKGKSLGEHPFFQICLDSCVIPQMQNDLELNLARWEVR